MIGRRELKGLSSFKDSLMKGDCAEEIKICKNSTRETFDG
jgi:hypothetical protein